MKYNNHFLLSLMTLSVVITLTGCGMTENLMTHDRSADLGREDYRRQMAARPLPELTNDSIPELQSFISTPRQLKPEMPLVSVSVNQTVSLRDLLFELSDQAEIDLELDPQIRGSIIFTARARPFDEVIDRITNMAGLRYKFKNNLLRIELDRPYLKTYTVSYVSFIRSMQSEISVDVSVVSGDEAEVGSSATLSTEAESDFWSELDSNLEQILTSSDNFTSLVTTSDPIAMARAPVIPVTIDGTTPPPPGPPVLEVRFPSSSQDPIDPNVPSAFSINKQSGMISVYSSARQHKEVRDYLTELRKISTAQVLIEARILEVGLTDEFATGIQWNNFSEINFTGLATAALGFSRPALLPASATTNAFTLALKPGSDINVVVSAMSRFGTVRALSSPRLTVLNNQSAMLSVVENRIFFDLDVSTETDADTGDTTVDVSSEVQSVPEGIMLTVIPSINLDTGEITLALRPTITRVTGTVDDPGLTIALLANPANAALIGQVTSPVPELAVQEIDSIVKMQSGQVIVMGGLMQDRNDVEEIGVPVLSEIPLFGNLFKSHTDKIVKSELVIFIKATVVLGSTVDDTDRDLYNNFSFDARPLRM